MWEFLMEHQLNLIFRIVVACICGVLVGYERKNRAKDAGIRTHCIVACASAMMMIISKYGFSDLLEGVIAGADVRLDPSRMAQGIVTGVGFLGSGMIYNLHGSTKGLTTAAGVWATSGIGMALGAGMYTIGIATTAIVLLVQFMFHAKTSFTRQHKSKILKITGVSAVDFEDYVTSELSAMHIVVNDLSIRKNMDHSFDYTFYIDIPETVNEEMLLRRFDYQCSLNFNS